MLEGEILYREAVLAGGDAAAFGPAWAKLRAAVDLNDGRVAEDEEAGATKSVFKLDRNGAGLVRGGQFHVAFSNGT